MKVLLVNEFLPGLQEPYIFQPFGDTDLHVLFLGIGSGLSVALSGTGAGEEAAKICAV